MGEGYGSIRFLRIEGFNVSYNRTLSELEVHASLHWTKELMHAASKETLLYDLLVTQEEFISVLKVANKTPLSWKMVLLESEKLTLPLFAKHLMVLCDLGGETLNKILPISNYFPDGHIHFNYNGNMETYCFQKIFEVKSLTNSSLKLTKATINSAPKEELLTDVIMILLYGSLAEDALLPTEYRTKTTIGSMLGNVEELNAFLKENYIRVSTQIKGAHSNALGHFAQNYVAKLLALYLPDDWVVSLEGSLSGVSHTGKGETNFDITAISPNQVEFGIEVSFQVTTNSVIERKARDSSALQERANALGHHICYVIDGAGNINVRKKAVETICSHSDCTVALTDSEIKVLSQYLLENG